MNLASETYSSRLPSLVPPHDLENKISTLFLPPPFSPPYRTSCKRPYYLKHRGIFSGCYALQDQPPNFRFRYFLDICCKMGRTNMTKMFYRYFLRVKKVEGLRREESKDLVVWFTSLLYPKGRLRIREQSWCTKYI